MWFINLDEFRLLCSPHFS